MVWTCRAQHRLDCRSTQAECGCTEKIWQAKEIMGWSAWEWQKEARYGFCWPSESFWVQRTPSRKTCQKAQPSVEENRALKWIWWWWCLNFVPYKSIGDQIWPCHKIGQGHSMVIIWINLVVLEYPMLHTNFQGHQPFGSREDAFLRFLPYMGMVAILVMWPRPFDQTFFPPSHGGST